MDEQRTRLIQQMEAGDFDFKILSLEVFDFQRKHNPIYRQYVELLNTPKQLYAIEEIPFLPIQFFKSHDVKTGNFWEPEVIYESSGTTGQLSSKHFVRSQKLYFENAQRIFEQQIGRLNAYSILALLPSYLERTNASLVAMCNYFMEQSGDANNGFFLNNYEELLTRLKSNKDRQKQTILIGVTYALLDLPVDDPSIFENTIVVETGGMKGRKKEITRSDLHALLQHKFGLDHIHSEYGMTELLSQAWSRGGGVFDLPITMDLLIREITDPFSYRAKNKTGVINIIDLANIDSCAFIATDDLGRKLNDRQFEILGRTDGSDIRGCNLMIGQEG